MSSSLRRHVTTSLWLASLSYSARRKRAGLGHFSAAIAALYINSSRDAAIVFDDAMPCSISGA